jgi:hypothetical protein
MSAAEPNLETLEQVHNWFTTDQPGLEERPFRDFAAALRVYLDIAGTARRGEQQMQFHEVQVSSLGRALELYAAQPTPRLEYVIGTRLDYLAGLQRNQRLILAIRQRYARTNIVVALSDRFLLAAAAEPVREPGTIRDCILGTAVRGTSFTTGKVEARPIPSENRALVELFFVGSVAARSKGYNSPVVVHTTSETQFTALQTIELTDDVFRVLPATADATTRSRIHAVCAQRGGLLGRIISRVGTRKAHESKPQAEAIASQHAERDLESDFGAAVVEGVTKLRRRYRDEFRYPLMRQGEYPEQVHYHSTAKNVLVDVTLANRAQLAAPIAPPPLEADGDVSVRFHQTAASNYTAKELGGATLSQTAADEDPQLDRPLPDWFEDLMDDSDAEERNSDSDSTPESFKPWSVTLRPGRPVTFGFDDQLLMLIVHMERFNYGSDEFENWDMIVHYDVRPHDGGLRLERQGEIEFLPTGFDPAINRRLPNRYVIIRQNLAKAVNDLNASGEGIPARLELPEVKPSGPLSHVGPLRVMRSESDDGWLTLGWGLAYR